MNSFSISQLSRFSGIKPHTIRIWERRYDTLKPVRSEGNTRYYDNTQLRRLLNIVSLMKSGYKVSELSAMTDSKLFQLIRELYLPETDDINEYYIFQLIAAGMDYDELHFDKIFSHCLLRYGIKDVYRKIIYPMLVRIGLMWSCDIIPPAHEHFISNLLRQKLFTAIDALPPAKTEDEAWLLFLPEDEFHEIGLLFAHYLIRLSGRKTIYMGTNVPLDSLSAAVKDTHPENLLLFLVHNEMPENIRQYMDGLCERFPQKQLYVACNDHLRSQVETRDNIKTLGSPEDLENVIQTFSV